jgi:twitching motility two-component system response regulator PilG
MDELHKRKVLVVDANPAVLDTVSAIFTTGPFACVTAGDTLEALCAVVEHRPAVVIVDADSGPLLPWQFCALLRQHPDHAAVQLVISCSRDDVLERARASAAGADQFLPKPFATDDVLALLDAASREAAA